METTYKKICTVILIWLAVAVMIGANTISIGSLISNGNKLDKSTVCIEAEVIGDVMIRGEKAWINVSDGSGVIGVYLDAVDAKKIKETGKYQMVGDKVRVEGVFYHAFEKQSGDMAIEATKLEVIQSGKKIEMQVEGYKWLLIGVLVPITMGLYVIKNKK